MKNKFDPRDRYKAGISKVNRHFYVSVSNRPEKRLGGLMEFFLDYFHPILYPTILALVTLIILEALHNI